jgi:hypothetical protein
LHLQKLFWRSAVNKSSKWCCMVLSSPRDSHKPSKPGVSGSCCEIFCQTPICFNLPQSDHPLRSEILSSPGLMPSWSNIALIDLPSSCCQSWCISGSTILISQCELAHA